MQATLRSSFIGTAGCRLAKAPVAAPSAAAPRQVTCMAKKKGVRMIVTLECTEARGEGATPSRYTTQKNKKNTPERMELMKFNKYLRRMTLHKEIK
ncbi:50S ribosomal L33 [Micractinium conductrix]|uniref:50S ribosomal L33 n=1 Tax=Micractinium conductrix TaxID=554055 RepID=A0A2P6VDR2_9CHLO|nr:50S ribosomal L33 [Micractinium conductrix]|eukprot:PSC72201.1 50S ribosomal L33 [Micractinium conductrix]